MAELPDAGDVARKDAPTCALDERLGDVKERVRAAGWDVCVVVNDVRVVLGFLREEELNQPPDRRIEEVMRPGPSTFRPHVPIHEMADFLRTHGVETTLITTSDGRLFGVLWREDVDRATHELHERLEHHHHEDNDE
jgi:predicted transcriptional regulator